MRILVYLIIAIGLSSCEKENAADNQSLNPNPALEFEPEIEQISRNESSEKYFNLGEYEFIGGYTQLPNNQDAYALCKRGDEIIWAKYFDRSPDDSRVSRITGYNNYLIIVFSCTGGNTDFEATEGAFQESYGSGGGPKIIYMARIESLSGGIKNATFVGCKLNNGNTNTIRIDENDPNPISINSDGSITLKAIKAYDRADGRLTPQQGADNDCLISGGGWTGVFNEELNLISGDCTP